jgi:hypothetical protein
LRLAASAWAGLLDAYPAGQPFKEALKLADSELTALVGRSAPSHTAVRLADSPKPVSRKRSAAHPTACFTKNG